MDEWMNGWIVRTGGTGLFCLRISFAWDLCCVVLFELILAKVGR